MVCEYPEGIRSVTPGQEAVIYDGNTVICGGKIDIVYQKEKNLMEEILRVINQ